ncbi:MAG: tetratricopeptide repeat-containing sensor histidine kinase, partial [Aurantibacter sp.]
MLEMSRIKTCTISLLTQFRCAFAFVVLAFLLIHPVSAQRNSRDSLETRINQIKNGQNFSAKDTVYIDLLNALGSELRFYKADSLFLLSQEAMTYSKEIGYNNGHCRALLGFGDYYSDKGSFENAIESFTQALELANKLEDSKLILRIQNNLAGEYGYKGDYAHALEIYLTGIEMAEGYGNKKMLSIMNENIANLYAAQKDYKQSLDFFKKVKKINAEIGNEVFIAETTSNMASVYADMGELEYAMFHINSSIAVFERHEIIDWLAFAYEIKGKTYLKQKKYKWALHWYRQGEMLHRDLEDTRGEIDLLNGMAEAYLGTQQDSISKIYATRAFEYSNAMKFKEGVQKCARTLYKINKNKGDFATALHYHEIFQKLSDTLHRNENKKSLTMLKTKVEHERQKEAWEIENQKSLAKQRNYIYTAVIILLIFLTVTILVRRSERIQRNLNSELNVKKTDLEKRESELREINATKDKLFSIIGHDLRGPIGAFQGLLKLFRDGEMSQKEFLGFIPKLRNDIDHISFTLNNLLSWGQSQMNGLITKPSEISVNTLVNENINLLSEIAENKSIKLISRLPDNTMAWSDGDQIDIVIRNLISNALKFTPENG